MIDWHQLLIVIPIAVLLALTVGVVIAIIHERDLRKPERRRKKGFGVGE